jgi:hypothetical protein
MTPDTVRVLTSLFDQDLLLCSRASGISKAFRVDNDKYVASASLKQLALAGLEAGWV